MKKFLSFSLLWLSGLIGFAQGIHGANGDLLIGPAPGRTGTPYAVKTVRDLSVYPLTTTGYNSFTTAIVSGVLDLTVLQSGCVIAAGTRPGLTPPNCTVSSPSWISGFRYSNNGTTLTFEGAGPIGQLKFEDPSGASFTAQNPDGVTINSGQFYGYGGLDGQAPYDRRWQINRQGPIRVTAQQAGGTATFIYNLTPANPASRVVLTGTNAAAPPVAPSWIAGFRYNYDGSVLTFEGAGNIATALFHPISGGGFPTTNPDNVTINADTPYGYGGLSGQGSYDRQWRLNYAGGSLSVTVQQVGTSATYSYNVTPVSGVNHVNLTGGSSTDPGSTTVTPGGTVSYRPISKVLIAANSIGFYPSLGWGLAASAANKDFFHILSDSIHTVYPGADVRLWGNFAGTSVAEGGYFEHSYDNLSEGLSRYDATAAFAPDVFIVRLGENVEEVRSTFQNSWKAMIDKVTSQSTNPIKIVTTGTWGNTTVDNAQITLAGANGYPLVDLRNVTGAQAGTENHPIDAAMLTYANRIWGVFKASVTTTSSTTTGNGNGGGGTYVTDNTPLAGPHNWQPLSPTVPGADSIVTLETNLVKVDLDLRMGRKPNKGLAGGIRRFVDKINGYNTLNIPVFRPGYGGDYGEPIGTINDGRGINICPYRYPGPGWVFNGWQYSTGDNPNETGDIGEYPSRLITYGKANNTLYTEIEPNIWGGHNTRLGDNFKKWIKVDANVMKVWYETKFNRNSATGANNVQSDNFHEQPCDYLNGNYSDIKFYMGDSPYSNDGNIMTLKLPSNFQQAPSPQYLTENWVAGCDPATGRCQGMILETPIAQLGQFGDRGAFLPDGSALSSTYISWFPRLTLDYNINWRSSVIFVTGTLPEIRQKAYEYTSWKRTPEYRFNQPGRQMWSLRDATDPGYQSSRSFWGPIVFGANDMHIWSPAMSLDGSIKKFYVKYKYASSSRSTADFYLTWKRARQDGGFSNGTDLWNQRYPDGAAVGEDYRKQLSMQADNQWHVLEIDLSNKPQWKGIITEFFFHTAGAISAGESISIEWISGNSNGPAN